MIALSKLHRLATTFIRRTCSGVMLAANIVAPAAGQTIDHLGVPGPIAFDGETYELAWTARPSARYIKQEYLPAGQRVESYRQMLLLELLSGGTKLPEVVRAQVDRLQARKGQDPLVNMSLVQNKTTGEVLLDFIVSGSDPKGGAIVEWNAYRYAPYAAADGAAGVMLFGISHRAYGDDQARVFLTGLKTFRTAQVDALARAPLPRPGKTR